MGKCKIENCDKLAKAKELCYTHYFRFKRHGNFDKPKIFREKLLEQNLSYCPACKQEKHLEEFNNDKYTFNGKAIYCKLCQRIKAAQKYQRNKDAHKNSNLKSEYNISLLEYNQMLEKQNNVCAICKKASKIERRLAVDHCHITKNVRGLLCSNCNLGIGHFCDDINLLQNAINYLK